MADYISQFTGSEIDSRLAKVSQLESGKQDNLVSGTNIKTINGQSVLGGGNITIQAGDTDAVKYVSQELTDAQKAQARANIDAASLEDIQDMDFVTATTLPTASASTMGHIYLIGPDANDNYDRYFTQESGGSYSWVPLGSTQIDLSTYATRAEVSQLEAKVTDLDAAVNGGEIREDISSVFAFVNNGGFYINQTVGATFSGELLYTSGGDYAPAVDVSQYDTIKVVDGGSSGNRAVVLTNSSNNVLFSEKWGDHTSDHTITINVSALGGKYLYISKGVGVSCVVTATPPDEGVLPRIEELEDSVEQIDATLNGKIEPLSFTESTGKMYLANASQIDESTSLYADVDMSEYEGKTIKITMSNIGIHSGRYTGLAVNGAFVASFAEKDYNGPVSWVVPGAAHLLESHNNTSNLSVEVITDGIEERMEDLCEKTMYVAKTGNDDNEGTEASPFLTIQKAITANASRIMVGGGIYEETLDLAFYGRKRLEILKSNSFKDVIIQATPTTIATSGETAVSGYTSVYKLEGVSGIVADMTFLVQVGVPFGVIPDSERRPEQRSKAYRLDDTIIRRAKTTISTVSDAEDEIERAYIEDGVYMYYLDGTTLYFSRPSALSVSNPLVRPTARKSLFNNVPDSMTFIMTGIRTRFLKFNITRSINSEITDCESEFSYGGGAFSYDGSVGVIFRRCEASGCNDGATGDGFNGHADNISGYSSGEPFSKCCTCTLEYCWSHDNNDDGYSDHQRCETTIIGGLFEYNGKGGVVPSYGSHCVCIDVESRHNCNGFFCCGTPDVTEGGVGTQLKCYGCMATDNTNKYGQNYRGGGVEENVGFFSVNDGCLIIAHNCISARNKIGYSRGNGDNGARNVLYDCKALDNSQTDWTPKSKPEYTIIYNGNGLSY